MKIFNAWFINFQQPKNLYLVAVLVHPGDMELHYSDLEIQGIDIECLNN